MHRHVDDVSVSVFEECQGKGSEEFEYELPRTRDLSQRAKQVLEGDELELIETYSKVRYRGPKGGNWDRSMVFTIVKVGDSREVRGVTWWKVTLKRAYQSEEK